MKPHFKKDIFGEKTCWIEKVRPVKEAYLTDLDFRKIDAFPEFYTLTPLSSLQGLLSLGAGVLILFLGYKLEVLSESKNDHNYFLILFTATTVILLFILFLNRYFRNNYKSPGRSLILTFENFTFAERTIAWRDVKAIYTIHQPQKNSGSLYGLRVKTMQNEIIEVNVHYYKIDKEKVPLLISAYKVKWDMRSAEQAVLV